MKKINQITMIQCLSYASGQDQHLKMAHRVRLRTVHSLSNEIPWVINFQQAKRMIQGDNKIVASYNTHQKNNA